MLLKDKVQIARKLAADALESYEFLDVAETVDLPEAEQLEIHSIITNALAAEIRGK